MSALFPNGNRVIVMFPSPGDLFVVTTLFGRVAWCAPIASFEAARKAAEAYCTSISARGVTAKVLCLSVAEMQMMGFAPADLCKHPGPDDAAMRRAVVTTCTDALRHSDDARVRAEALQLLNDMGAMQ